LFRIFCTEWDTARIAAICNASVVRATAGLTAVVSLDNLGLERVYVQAKRWQNVVGRLEIQALYGEAWPVNVHTKASSSRLQATPLRPSTLPVPLNASCLWHGRRLAALLIDHEVGLTVRTLKCAKVRQ
jgi:restriction system protein